VVRKHAAEWEASIGRQVKAVPSFTEVVAKLRTGLERIVI